jgi:methylated-DNA-[protein]-cysteine S-methyltransferase
MTQFEARVYQIVKKIPKGKVLTYKQVAEKLGNKNLARAVGNALNKNRDLRVPCRRVIKSDGQIGGYNRGRREKIRLLKREGVRIEEGEIEYKKIPDSN